MSEPLSLTTELEAVNAILASVGESPVVDFSGEFVDAELARNLLRQDMRALQLKGWHWNTDLEVVYSPDNDGIIWIPPTTLSITFEDVKLTRRGSRVYDPENHTHVFSTSVTATKVVSLLEYDEMPEAARQFVYQRSGRKFQDQMGGDDVAHRFQQNDELMAWANLNNEEAEHTQYNALRSSTLLLRMKGNR
jgi:hypothetical protein